MPGITIEYDVIETAETTVKNITDKLSLLSINKLSNFNLMGAFIDTDPPSTPGVLAVIDPTKSIHTTTVASRPPPQQGWVRNILSVGNSEFVTKQLLSDSHGNTIMFGYYISTDTVQLGNSTTLPATSTDGFPILIKYNEQGIILSARRLESISFKNNCTVAIDSSDNIIIAGVYYGNDLVLPNTDPIYNNRTFIIKYDENGNIVWGKSYTTNKLMNTSISGIDKNNNIYFTGLIEISSGDTSIVFNSTKTLNISAYPWPSSVPFINKCNTNGVLMWVSTYRPTDTTLSTATDVNGNTFLVGKSSQSYGTILAVYNEVGARVLEKFAYSNRTYTDIKVSSSKDRNSVIIYGSSSGSSNYEYVFGFYTPNGSFMANIKLLDTDIEAIWYKHPSIGVLSNIKSVTMDKNNNTFIYGQVSVGSLGNNVSVTTVSSSAIVKYDAIGNAQWVKSEPIDTLLYPSRTLNSFYSSTTMNDSMITSGKYLSDLGGFTYINKISSNGTIQELTKDLGYIGTGGLSVYHTMTDTNNNIVMVGYYNGINSISIGNGFVLPAPVNDYGHLFVLKYNNKGVVQMLKTFNIKTIVVSSLKIDKNNNILFCGYYTNPSVVLLDGSITLPSAADYKYILKMNELGVVQWAIQSPLSIEGLIVDKNNNIITISKLNSTTSVIPLGNNLTIPITSYEGTRTVTIKYNENYVAQWVKMHHPTAYSYGIDNDDNIIFHGRYNKNSIISLGDGVTLPAVTVETGCIIKIDKDGLSQWAKTLITKIPSTSLLVDKNNNIIIYGFYGSTYSSQIVFDSNNTLLGIASTVTNGYQDQLGFIVKFNSGGILQYAKNTNTEGWASSTTRGVIDGNNNVIIRMDYIPTKSLTIPLGNSVSIAGNYGKSSTSVIKYNENGVAQWAKYYNIWTSGMMNIAVDMSNNIITSGIYNNYTEGVYNDINISSNTKLTAPRNRSLFVIKYLPSGDLE